MQTENQAKAETTPKIVEGRPRLMVGDIVKVVLPGWGGQVLTCKVVHVNEGRVRFSLTPLSSSSGAAL